MRAVEEVPNLLTLQAETRGLTKAETNRARRRGFVPAVVYGKAVAPVPIMVPAEGLQEILRRGGRNRLIRLEGPALERPCTVLIKELQHTLIRRDVVHVDFFEPLAGQPINVRVPLVVEGDEELTRRGLVLERHLAEVECQCMPDAVPDALRVQVAHLGPGEQIFLRELPLPQGVRLVGLGESVVVSVAAPAPAAAPGGEEVAVPAGE